MFKMFKVNTLLPSFLMHTRPDQLSWFKFYLQGILCIGFISWTSQGQYHHHLLLSPLGTQGINKTSPSDPISGQLLNFTPALPFFQCLVVDRSPPHLFRSPSPPFPLWVPIQSLPFNGFIRARHAYLLLYAAEVCHETVGCLVRNSTLKRFIEFQFACRYCCRN